MCSPDLWAVTSSRRYGILNRPGSLHHTRGASLTASASDLVSNPDLNEQRNSASVTVAQAWSNAMFPQENADAQAHKAPLDGEPLSRIFLHPARAL